MSLAVALAVPREAVKRRVVVWVMVLSVAFLGLFALGVTLLVGALPGQGSDEVVAITSTLTVLGLYIVSFLGSLLAILLGAGSVAAEVDGGLAAAVLARPITRRSWLFQRWGALVVMVSAFVVVTAGVVMLLARVVAGYSPESWVGALALMVLQAVTVLTLTTMLSTRLGIVAAGVASFAGFGAAWLAGIIEFIGDGVANQAMVNSGIAVSLVLPSDALWRAASYYATTPAFLDTVLDGSEVPFASADPPTVAFLIWSLALVGVWLAIANNWFRRRDL